MIIIKGEVTSIHKDNKATITLKNKEYFPDHIQIDNDGLDVGDKVIVTVVLDEVRT